MNYDDAYKYYIHMYICTFIYNYVCMHVHVSRKSHLDASVRQLTGINNAYTYFIYLIYDI